MTVPINIPIITTSPPSVKSAKSFIKPEKSGDFEQILKQKTSETSQADNGILQNDHAVKVQPKNNIESEEKSTQEDTKSEKLGEENKSANRANENAQSQMICQLEPPLVQTQAVPVLTLNSTPIDQTKLEVSSETIVDQTGEGGSVSTTPAETASLQKLSALSALPGEPVMNTPSTDKMTFRLQSEVVDEEAGSDVKVVKASDQPIQTQEKDPSIFQAKPDSRFDTASQSLSSAQDMAKATGQSMASAAAASTEADEGTILNQNDTVQTANLDSGSIKGESVSKPGQSGLVKEKSFTTSAKLGQDPEIQGENLPKTDGQPAGVTSANKALAEDVRAVLGGKGITSTGKPEREMVPEAPPDSPGEAPPASTPGVVTDRMKVDLFTGKINEPARLAEAQSTEILRQIGRQVAGSPNSGSQTIRIQLHPEDLGQIELRITSSSQGTHVSLIADQAVTGKLLETHIAQLKQTLSDAGVQMADVHVGQQASQQSFRDPQSSQNPQQKNFRYDNRTVLGTDEIASNRSHSNSSLVDYRI